MAHDIMFQVFYNPNTKEVYTNDKGVVLEYDDESAGMVKELADKGYYCMNVVDSRFVMLDSEFNNVFDKFCLVYGEHFCVCDMCGQMFLQDDLTFTEKGAPYCNDCYNLSEEKYNKYFQFQGLEIVSRGDYEGLPIPMYGVEFTDDQMNELARLIYQMLNSNYRYSHKDLEDYFNHNNPNKDEDLDMAFWKEMEEIAVQMGMRYYEDMTEEEYNELNQK